MMNAMFYGVAALIMVAVSISTLPKEIIYSSLVCILEIHCMIRIIFKYVVKVTRSGSRLFGVYYFLFGVLPCMLVAKHGKTLPASVGIVLLCIAVVGFNVVLQRYFYQPKS